MLPYPLDHISQLAERRRMRRQTGIARAGFTLMEMLIAVSILGFSAAAISGVMLAINSAWSFSSAQEDGRRQAQSTLTRIKWMVQQAGTYKVTGASTTLGLAVVSSTYGTYQPPMTLVVWSGGSSGGMTSQGLQSRLPLASELVVYTPDPVTPTRFVELTFPGNSTQVDFQSASFAATVQSLVALTTRQTVVLSDRMHVVSGQGAGLTPIGCIRFEVNYSPTDSQISAVVIGSQDWNNLNWGQGLVGANEGLRTANLRIEILLDPDPVNPVNNSDGYTTAIPYFGSVNRQYVYQP